MTRIPSGKSPDRRPNRFTHSALESVGAALGRHRGSHRRVIDACLLHLGLLMSVTLACGVEMMSTEAVDPKEEQGTNNSSALWQRVLQYVKQCPCYADQARAIPGLEPRANQWQATPRAFHGRQLSF